MTSLDAIFYAFVASLIGIILLLTGFALRKRYTNAHWFMAASCAAFLMQLGLTLYGSSIR